MENARDTLQRDLAICISHFLEEHSISDSLRHTIVDVLQHVQRSVPDVCSLHHGTATNGVDSLRSIGRSCSKQRWTIWQWLSSRLAAAGYFFPNLAGEWYTLLSYVWCLTRVHLSRFVLEHVLQRAQVRERPSN